MHYRPIVLALALTLRVAAVAALFTGFLAAGPRALLRRSGARPAFARACLAFLAYEAFLAVFGALEVEPAFRSFAADERGGAALALAAALAADAVGAAALWFLLALGRAAAPFRFPRAAPPLIAAALLLPLPARAAAAFLPAAAPFFLPAAIPAELLAFLIPVVCAAGLLRASAPAAAAACAAIPAARLVGHLAGPGPGSIADALAALAFGAAARAWLRRPAAAGAPARRRWDGYGLSPRELDVLVLLEGGASAKAVARELGISANTARNHCAAIYRKLGIGSRAELAALLRET